MTSSSYVIQQLIPTLAAQLTRLRRTPGRNNLWVDQGLKALERADAARFDRMRRRIGFAARLGDMAALDSVDAASLTLGLFFHELAFGHTHGKMATTDAWLAYLLRNEDWLCAAFQISEEIAADGWRASDSKIAIVANVTVAYDGATIERHERPLQVIQELMSEAESETADEVIPLLWSEQGQELCDFHFRRPPGSYKLTAKYLQGCLETLNTRGITSRVGTGAVAAFRLSGSQQRAEDEDGNMEEQEENVQEPAARPRPARQPAETGGVTFDRRREMLRARAAFGLRDSAPTAKVEANGARSEGPEAQQEPTAVMIESAPASTDGPMSKIGMPEPHEEVQQPPAETVQRVEPEEVRVEPRAPEQTRPVTPLPARKDALDMMQKLQDVRLQLGEIQRAALDAEQLLTGLAPQLDELASWIEQIDSILGRRRGQDSIERAA
jgi:hypothetical protein